MILHRNANDELYNISKYKMNGLGKNDIVLLNEDYLPS